MTDNLRIWNALGKTDPRHTKQFSRAGGFKGTATKPIWLTMRLTEHFGPAGIGWGMEKPEFQTVTANDEVLVYCTVALWHGSKDQVVYGVGGDKVVVKRQSGAFTNDEAFKAAYTDALSNAMKQIGVAADIHMGLFDDQKYVREVGQEFANANAEAQQQPPPAHRVGQSAEPRGLQHVHPDDRHLIAGDGRSAYQIKTGEKGPGRLAAELWASTVVGLFRETGFDVMAYQDWLKEPCTNKGTKTHEDKLAELREKHPDLGQKIDEAADALRLAVA